MRGYGNGLNSKGLAVLKTKYPIKKGMKRGRKPLLCPYFSGGKVASNG
jgi:hypothetical protein